MSVRLTVCATCKLAPDAAFDARGRTGGELLAAALAGGIAARGAAVTVAPHDCLWACREHCVVLVEGTGRTGYLAGRFAPDAGAAAAILDWCAAYAATADGQVPYEAWPKGMMGHFIARIPAHKDMP